MFIWGERELSNWGNTTLDRSTGVSRDENTSGCVLILLCLSRLRFLTYCVHCHVVHLADDRSSNMSMATTKEGQHQDQWRPGQSTSKSVHRSRKWSHDIGSVFQTVKKKPWEWNLLLGNLQLEPIHNPFPRGHLAVSGDIFSGQVTILLSRGHRCCWTSYRAQDCLLTKTYPAFVRTKIEKASNSNTWDTESLQGQASGHFSAPLNSKCSDTFWSSLLCGDTPRCVQIPHPR